MNKENAHLYLPLVQALAEGKTIQNTSRDKKEWWDAETLSFTMPPDHYRIKPEPPKPLDVWVYVNPKTNLPDSIGFIVTEKPLNSNFRQFREVLQPE